MTEGLRVVREGLRQGDIIVVSGLQRVVPEPPSRAKTVSMGSKANALSDTSTQSALARQRQFARIESAE